VFNLSASVVSIIVSISIFFVVVAFFSYYHYSHNRKDKWLFSQWQEKIYDTLIKDDPVTFGNKIKFDVSEYMHNCLIARTTSKPKNVIINKLVGYIIFFCSVLIGIFFMNLWIILIGLTLSIPLIAKDTYTAEKLAKKRKNKLEYELPRFLDLLHTALSVNIPIEEAIIITCDNMKNTVISEEFLASIADAQIGNSNWQVALEILADKFGIDVLSDLVLDIINTFNKGSSILESVERQSKDIKKSNLLSMKENASKLTNTILFPVLLFKIFPVLLFMLIPIIQQLNTTLL
jgi:tight adherence protein C